MVQSITLEGKIKYWCQRCLQPFSQFTRCSMTFNSVVGLQDIYASPRESSQSHATRSIYTRSPSCTILGGILLKSNYAHQIMQHGFVTFSDVFFLFSAWIWPLNTSHCPGTAAELNRSARAMILCIYASVLLLHSVNCLVSRRQTLQGTTLEVSSSNIAPEKHSC